MAMSLVTKDGILIGRCIGDDDQGWRFLPNTTSHKPSRKAWPSAVACIPRWAFDLSNDLLTAEEWADLRKADRKNKEAAK